MCTHMLDSLKEIDVMGEILSTVNGYEKFHDEIAYERRRKMAQRTSKMDTDYYVKFSSARRTSFCSRNGKISDNYAKSFLEWLGAPPINKDIAFVLNFCATEIITILVNNSILCQETEVKGSFIDESPASSLQVRHYQEALRRNSGYAKRKDILFGNF